MCLLGHWGFSSYTEEVSEVFNLHAVNYHMFADDKQLSYFYKVSETGAVVGVLSA